MDVTLGLGSVVSGIAGLFGQRSANKAMLQANRETNEQNYRIWGEQKEHNIDMFNRENEAAINMWNMQNEYNDPSAAVQRLQAAGLNPYLAMNGSGAAGNASSPATSGTADPAQAPQMQMAPVQAFDSGIIRASQMFMDSLGGLADVQLKGSQKKGQDIGNEWAPDLNASYLALQDAQTKNHRADTGLKLESTKFQKELVEGQKLSNEYNRRTLDQRVKHEELRTVEMSARNAGLMLDNKAKTICNQFLGAEKTYALMEQGQRIMNLNMDFKTKVKMLNVIYGKALSEIGLNNVLSRQASANAEGQEQQNKAQAQIIPSMVEATVRANMVNSEHSRMDLQNMNYGDPNGTLNKIIRSSRGVGSFVRSFSPF